MAQAIVLCLNTYQHYHQFPVIVVICTVKVDSDEVDKTFTPHESLKLVLETPCLRWAKECLMLSKDSIEADHDDENTLPVVILAVEGP